MTRPKSICIFGDSTAWGAWDEEKGGWVNRLWLHVGSRDENYAEIYNLSISGGTTETILERFENEAKIRKADALIFQTGGNDASYKSSPNNLLISPEKFAKNITEILTRARKITQNVVFMDLKNCDESLTMPWWDDLYFVNDNMQKYGQIMKKVCEENNTLFLDVGLLEDQDFYDGLHPNARGHEKVFIKVRDFLTENGWI